MLSGFTLPVRDTPLVVQYLTYLDPLRYFMEVVRGIFLNGIGLPVIWPKMLVMFRVRHGNAGMSAMRFRKN